MEEVKQYLAKIGRKGGKARLTKMTSEERIRVARQAAEARWAKMEKLAAEIDSGTKALLVKVKKREAALKKKR
jgi:hypothetical protein